MDRLAPIADLLDGPPRRILEAGPLDRPLVRSGPHLVQYLDHLSTDELRDKYRIDGAVDLSRVPEIDFVIRDNDLTPIRETGQRFDLIIGCHMFEHLPDPLGWLIQVSQLLTPDGGVYLVVPDRRYSFDMMRPDTTLSEWVESYLLQRRHPSVRSVFDNFALPVDPENRNVWVGSFQPESLSVIDGHGPKTALPIATRAAKGHYIDAHCSVFSPWSLVDLFRQAADLELFPFRVAGIWPTDYRDTEFAILLKPWTDGAQSGDRFPNLDRARHDGRPSVWTQPDILKRRAANLIGRLARRVVGG
jgi:SAM-dependent methyltransferase